MTYRMKGCLDDQRNTVLARVSAPVSSTTNQSCTYKCLTCSAVSKDDDKELYQLSYISATHLGNHYLFMTIH